MNDESEARMVKQVPEPLLDRVASKHSTYYHGLNEVSTFFAPVVYNS